MKGELLFPKCWPINMNYHRFALIFLLALAGVSRTALCVAQEIKPDPFPDKPGHHWLHFPIKLSGKPAVLNYIVYVPNGYEASRKATMLPVLLAGLYLSSINPPFEM